jgi:Fe-S-cluster containining protein
MEHPVPDQLQDNPIGGKRDRILGPQREAPMSGDEDLWTPGTPVDYDHAVEMLEDLYNQLPPLECKGKCWDTCTAVETSELERQQLAKRGVTLPDVPATKQLRVYAMVGDVPRCPALTAFNTCGAYTDRPFTCRAFGMVLEPGTPRALTFRSAMMCDYGCVPDGTISLAQYVGTLDKIEMLSRAVTGVTRRQTMQEAMDALLPPAPPRGKRKGKR